MVSAVHPKYFQRQIPDATLYKFPEGKHNIHLRYADEFNAQVATFLKGGEATTEEYVNVGEIEAKSPASGDRVQTLLTAIASLKLVKLDRSTMRYTNTPAAQDELVSTSRKYWGDYIKHQVDAQFYQRMQGLRQTMETGDSTENYVEWFKSDP